MESLLYYYSKIIKKIVRGKCIYKSNVDKTSIVNSGCSIYNSSIGRYSYLGYDCEIIDAEIGSYCSLGSGIHIGLAEHPLDWISTSPVFQDVSNSSLTTKFASIAAPPSKRTIIGHDVWVGTNVIIKAGVEIGTGAVIASGAIVTKDVKPYAIVGGCPAHIIRYRFEQIMINELLASRWWELRDEQLLKIAEDIDKPMVFLSKIKAMINKK